MILSELKLFEFLTHELKLPETKAKQYVNDLKQSEELLEQKIEDKIEKKFRDNKDILASKEDTYRIEVKIEKLRAEFLVVKWMLGVVLAGIISLILKTFFT